jgi:hypothetical protein
VAARKLPADMPAFFRKAVIELGYLCGEPDRWRSATREPSLRGLAHRDHTFRLEEFAQPLPAHRYDFYSQYAGKPKPGGGVYEWADMAFAPYAIAERSEMLAVSFMLWRKARSASAEDRRVRRQIEQNIIHIAGVLGHFVTDTAQPLHVTVHGNGWLPHYPNPRNFTGPPDIHARFESDYVNQAIDERDVEALVPDLRPRGPWLEAAMEHMRESFAHVETVYSLDQQRPFGLGAESPEHARFATARLAAAAGALRDFWYSAWRKSATLPELNSAIQYTPVSGARPDGSPQQRIPRRASNPPSRRTRAGGR